MSRGAERDFDAAAADVNPDRGAAADVDSVGGRQMDQTRFFSAGNNADPYTCLSPNFGNKVTTVFRLAGRAGGRRDNFVNLVGVGQALELRERLESGRHGGIREVPSVESTGPEPDHILFAINNFEG